MAPAFDESRATQSLTGRPDPRLAAAIERALGDARTVVHAGAGTWESPDRELMAAAAGGAPQQLASEAADAALLIGPVEDGDDARRLLAELVRAARKRVVAFTYDPDEAEALWLVRDYLPELGTRARARFLGIDELVAALGAAEVSAERVPVPHDCRDARLLGAFWRRPERYLDPALREGDGPLAGIEPGALGRGLDELRTDLDGGAWRRRYGGLLGLEELDVGYRLVTAELQR